MDSHHQDTKLLKDLYHKVVILTNPKKFEETYGFSLDEYFKHREQFAKYCKAIADDIEKVTKKTGIAKTVSDSVGILSGVTTILGVLLAPISGGASLALSATGLATGLASGGSGAITEVVKEELIRKDLERIKACLAKFENQEKVIFLLFHEVQNDFRCLENQLSVPSKLDTAEEGAKGAIITAINVNSIRTSVKAIREFTKFAQFLRNPSVTAAKAAAVGSKLVDEIAGPGVNFGVGDLKVMLTAGTTTAKLLSGTFAAAGIVLSILDIKSAVKDMHGSKVADAYRSFAKQYDEKTANLESAVKELSILVM